MNKNYVLKLTCLLLMCSLCFPTYISACKHTKVDVLLSNRQLKKRTCRLHSRHRSGLKKGKEKRQSSKSMKAVIDSLPRETAALLPSVHEWQHTVLPWLTFISPEHRTLSEEVMISGTVFPSSEEAVTGRYTDMDHRAFAQINALITNLEKQLGTTVSSVWITGYSAPKGTPRKSEKVAMKRLSAVKETFGRNLSTADIPIKVGWISEDWDSISVLSGHSDIPFRTAVTGIINNPSITENRERTLSRLDAGIPYAYLKERLYPKVERIKYEIGYRQIGGCPVENDSLDKGGLTYEALYASAQCYGHDTEIFSDLIGLGPKLFPSREDACINAGAVAVLHKDTALARKYLEPYAMKKEAWSDMGILCLLEGKTESAALYLKMAAASGSVEAEKALVYIKKTKYYDTKK